MIGLQSGRFGAVLPVNPVIGLEIETILYTKICCQRCIFQNQF